ncbi:transferase hexapeptide (six repeat-containing protein) [Marinobacter segnicrescens]|uniref:Serine acetyltransferase n=1 Tax=Marinobacter segnicrescens TaxID=430453 RepID=A0A1I0HYC3_9GAMM|nr:hypothetical protein [Marinobacter segnicrescens]SET88398.1 transferase hexapeptide (six repeat-containing protein) [Marinobacter segnicrescens]
MRLARLIGHLFMGGVQPRVLAHMKLMLRARQQGHMSLARWISARMQLKYGVFISEKSNISSSLRLKHPVGVVIGEGVTIGENVVVYQNVTIGGARMGDSTSNSYPSVGRNTVIFAGAVLAGKINVGQNCIIGANAVVLDDVPDGCTAVGVPARIIRRPEQAQEEG